MSINKFFNNPDDITFDKNNNNEVAEYIMNLLSYILSLKSCKNFNNLNKFYEAHIKENMQHTILVEHSSHYTMPNTNSYSYTNFKGLIYTNTYLMNIDIEYMIKFYVILLLVSI